METIWIVLAAISSLWILAEFKTSRPDGTLVKTHPYRRLMAFIMPTRAESVVFFDRDVRCEKLLAYVEQARAAFGANVTHCAVIAMSEAIASAPTMNRFVLGRRVYQRKGRWITFSMKRKKLNRKAKIAVVKMEMKEGETFKDLVQRINEKISVERSDTKTYADKEFALFNALPRPILRGAATLLKVIDYYNLMPGAFIETDSMYTSAVVANLGSLGMDAGYHHLYEWGNCHVFGMFGRVVDQPVVENGQLVAGKVMRCRFTFDERSEDGINAHVSIERLAEVLEDPFTHLGCLKEDGSDAVPLGRKDLDTAAG